MSLTFWLISSSVILATAWASRMDGGGPPKTPEIVERLIAMLPVLAYGSLYGWVAMFIASVGVVGRATGHGLYFLARQIKATTPEFFDFMLRPFFGRDPRTSDEFADLRNLRVEEIPVERLKEINAAVDAYGYNRLYWRCVAGMSVTGVIVTLPLACILIAAGEVLSPMIVFVAGAQKGLSYMIGYHLRIKNWNRNFPMYLHDDTEIAEFLNGLLLALLLAVAYQVQVLT